jgi:hypothetical protein
MEIDIKINNENISEFKKKAFKFIKTNILFFWLGFGISLFGHIYINNISWWLIMVPACILNGIQEMWANEEKDKSQDVLLNENS